MQRTGCLLSSVRWRARTPSAKQIAWRASHRAKHGLPSPDVSGINQPLPVGRYLERPLCWTRARATTRGCTGRGCTTIARCHAPFAAPGTVARTATFVTPVGWEGWQRVLFELGGARVCIISCGRGGQQFDAAPLGRYCHEGEVPPECRARLAPRDRAHGLNRACTGPNCGALVRVAHLSTNASAW